MTALDSHRILGRVPDLPVSTFLESWPSKAWRTERKSNYGSVSIRSASSHPRNGYIALEMSEALRERGIAVRWSNQRPAPRWHEQLAMVVKKNWRPIRWGCILEMPLKGLRRVFQG